MENPMGKKPFSCIFLILLQVLLGIGAVFGGVVLIIDPSGGLIKLPLYLLDNSPFNDFLIPGLILLVTIGVLPLFTSYGLITKWDCKLGNTFNIYFPEMHWAWTSSLYTGFALIIWITVEAFYIKQMGAVHVFYIFWGLGILAVTVLPSVQKYFRVR